MEITFDQFGMEADDKVQISDPADGSILNQVGGTDARSILVL
jgi:hypothetical protein